MGHGTMGKWLWVSGSWSVGQLVMGRWAWVMGEWIMNFQFWDIGPYPLTHRPMTHDP